MLVGGDGFGPQAGLGIALTALILAGTYAAGAQAVRAARRLPGDRARDGRGVHPGQLLVRPAAHPRGAARHAGRSLGLLLALAQAAGAAAGRGWLLAVGAAVGLSTLTKPEYVLAAAVAVVAWLVVRRHASAAPWRDAALIAAPAVAIPLVVYGPLALAAGVARPAVREPLPGRHAGRRRRRHPAEPHADDRLELRGARRAARALRRRRGGAGDRRAAHRPRRTRPRGGRRPASALGALALCASLVANPEARAPRPAVRLRLGPLGAAAGAVLDRAAGAPQREPLERGRPADVRRHGRARGAVVHALQRLLPALRELADGRVLRAVRRRAARRACTSWRSPGGARRSWSARCGCSSSSPPARCSRCPTRTTRRARCTGPGGSITAPASDAAAFQGAVDAIAANTRPGEPILAAPFLTSLYVLAERPDPVSAIVAAARHVPHGCGRAGRHRASSSATASGSRSRRAARSWSTAKRPSETPSGASSTAGSAATSRTCKH